MVQYKYVTYIKGLSHFSMIKVLVTYSYIQGDWNNVLKTGVHLFIRRILCDCSQLSVIMH
jgi:hypothetical protein